MSDAGKIPRAAALLGYGGLVPFVAGAAAAWLGGAWAPAALEALQAYGAAILAFLGGLQWGLALAPRAAAFAERLAVGVLPALVAWGAMLAPATGGIGITAVALLLLLGWDLWRNGPDTPPWYGRLRTHLTLTAVACLAIAAASVA